MAAFDSLKISEEFLQTLPKRVRDVLERRFGIGKSKERKTLEAIGAAYGITRERVRQIEEFSLNQLSKTVSESPDIAKYVSLARDIPVM